MTRCRSEKTINGKTYRCCLKATDYHRNGHVNGRRHWELTEAEETAFKTARTEMRKQRRSGAPLWRETFRKAITEAKKQREYNGGK